MAVGKAIKYYLLNNVLSSFLYHLVKLHSGTIRLTVEGAEALRERLAAGGSMVLASWHQRFYSGFHVPGSLDSPICIMISASRDGDFVAKIVSRMGWVPIRGSDTYRGKAALREMTDGIRQYRVGVHIVDGPLGPPGVIKRGLITLAQKTNSPIIPGCVSYENPWVFNSWDRFMVPKPFSRVLIRYGPFIPVPPDELDDERFEELRQEVERIMARAYAEVDAYWKKQRVDHRSNDSINTTDSKFFGDHNKHPSGGLPATG